MYYIGVRDGKKGKKGKINLCSLVFCPTIYFSRNTQNLKTVFHRSWEICNRKIDWRQRKNGQINGMIISRRLILFYTIQQVIPNICTKCQNPRRSRCWEIFNTNFPMYYIRVRDRKNGKKDGKNKSQHLGFLFQNILGHSQSVYKIWTGSHRSWEIYNRKFDGQKEKWTNHGNGKQQEPDSLLHNTSHTQHLYQISKS